MANSAKNLITGDDGQKIMWSRTRQLVVKEKDSHVIFLVTASDGVPRGLDVHRPSL